MAAAKSELILFDKVLPQVVVKSSQWSEHHPVATLIDNAPFEFQFTTDSYMDLTETVLYVKFKVNAGEGYTFAPINNLLSSAFSDIEVSVNGKTIENTNYMYPYKSMFTTLLNYNADAKNSTLPCSGYIADEAGKMDQKENSGFVKRSGLKVFEFMGPLILDMFNQSKLMLPNVSMRIKLKPARENFVLQAFKNAAGTKFVLPTIKIEDCRLYVRNVQVADTVRIAHELGLKQQNATYEFQKMEMKSWVVSAGLTSISIDNLFDGRIPKLFVFGMVKNSAFNGSYEENPFNFQHFNVNFIGVYRDGTSVPRRELCPDFNNGLCMNEYVCLMQSLGLFYKNRTNSISIDEYRSGGYNLFGFNLTADLSFESKQVTALGNLKLDLRFTSGLASSINIVAFGLFDDEIQISEKRQIFQ